MSLNAVTDKIPCIYEIEVTPAASKKHAGQNFSTIATGRLAAGCAAIVADGVATEKIDGTCCMVRNGQLCRRHDRKLSKQGEANLLKLPSDAEFADISWQPGDWKDVPATWTTDFPCPTGRHWIGWVPVTAEDKWHATALSPDGLAANLVVPKEGGGGGFEVRSEPLAAHEGESFELIGSKVQSNPYRLPGTAHLLVRHGSLAFAEKPPTTLAELVKWFENDPNGAVEGIVWHSPHGMAKIHRHHLGLPWPLADGQPLRMTL
eukprot:NODE_3091_length_1052_cov_24.282154_g2839_i0.p1 GENE.NODE_3091_length_1052_cov_24.282154_g2839_i0~~NODE_3091_length_1052_cov_24.282154_g2839_i0.p1  ORF type:complete len:293 (+),score=54.45 NODE_3091_length_1052_cov_24.282154_g2839_i0:96-881(+)